MNVLFALAQNEYVESETKQGEILVLELIQWFQMIVLV